MIRPIELAQDILRRRLKPGDVVIDATVGNGHDTLFLLNTVGPTGKVYAIDCQLQALHKAMKLVRDHAPDLLSQVEFLEADHSKMADFIPPEHVGKLGAVMFNLGYLPGGNPALITRPETTLRALKIAAKWLRPGGVLSVVAYIGHEGGEEEATAVEDFFCSLGSGWHCWQYYNLNPQQASPFLISAEKV